MKLLEDEDYLTMALEATQSCQDVSFYGVGCVVVTPEGRVFKGFTGEERHSKSLGSRQKHAEEIAIEKARRQGVSLKGATLYSTLEPCSERRSGLTPCVAMIISSGITRVVYGAKEPYHPDLKIICRGDRMLREAGIEVLQLIHFEKICLASALKGCKPAGTCN